MEEIGLCVPFMTKLAVNYISGFSAKNTNVNFKIPQYL